MTAVIEVPSTMLQTDAIGTAAQKRGMSVGDYILDCALTYAANHLQLGLAGAVAIEQEYVAQGHYPPCGQKNTIAAGTQFEHNLVCVRVKGHRTEAVVQRDSHVGPDPQGNLTSWELKQ